MPPSSYNDAKDQAQSLGLDLVAAPLPTGAGDHWAVTCRASIGAPLEMVLDDPPAERGGPPPAPVQPDFPQDDPFERLLQGYYQVVGDIEALIALSPGDISRPTAFEDGYLGAPLAATNVWIGAGASFSARAVRGGSEKC